MEKLGRSNSPRGLSVDRELSEASSKLNERKRLLKIVNLSKLPDKGARLKKEIDNLEKLLEALNLQAVTAEKTVCEERNHNSSSCSEDADSGEDHVENSTEVRLDIKSSKTNSASVTRHGKELSISESSPTKGELVKENEYAIAGSSKHHVENYSSQTKNSKCSTGAIPKYTKQIVTLDNKDSKKFSADNKDCIKSDTVKSNNNVADSGKGCVENNVEAKRENKPLKYSSVLVTKSGKELTTSDTCKTKAELAKDNGSSKHQVENYSYKIKNSKCSTGAIPKQSKQIVTPDNKDSKIFSDNNDDCMKSVTAKSNSVKSSSSVGLKNSGNTEKNKQHTVKSDISVVSKLIKQTSHTVQNKNDTTPGFKHRFEAELASFDQLSKIAPKSEDTLKDLVDSPSFKNWRHTNQISGIKLTEAKPLFETLPVYKCKSKYTTNLAAPLATEEVKKLHHSLCTYPNDAEKITPPKSLTTPLLKHQIEGLSWLIWRESQQPSGGILADDMGLGKTLTMISLVLKQKEENNYFSENSDDSTCGTLIVCLASIVHQWKDEVNKHCKDGALTTLLYHGPKRDRDIDEMRRYDIVVTTYSTLLSERKSLMKDGKPTGLFQLKWERVILDEAHTIKNYKSQTADAVFNVRSCRRWCVTGTPIHNEFKDMYSLVKFLQFSLFDDEKKWKKLINDDNSSSERRRNLLVKSILLRRTKEDTDKSGKPLIKMVDKSVNVCTIELSEAEQIVYDKLDSKIKEILNKIFTKAIKKLNTSNTLLVLLLRLQQCCCHISLLGKEAADETFSNDSLQEQSLESNSNDSVQELSLNMSSLAIKDKSDVSNSSSSTDSTLDFSFSECLNNDLCDPYVKSTKLQKLYEMIDRIARNSDGKDKSVIVSQWVSLLDIVAKHLQQVGIEYHMIAGSTKAEDRQRMSDDFNKNDDGFKIMLLSLKAGGVGLNLIGGNNMFLLDLHWNPALERQACDRIHRVGQTKDVTIYKFVCKNTIEQRIFELQKQKSELANDILHGAGKISKGLSMDDFKSLFDVRL